MKTTLEIPDELYRRVKVLAAQENRKIKDIVSEGLSLVLGFSRQSSARQLRRMTKAPVRIRPGHKIRALSNQEMAELMERSGERLP